MEAAAEEECNWKYHVYIYQVSFQPSHQMAPPVTCETSRGLRDKKNQEHHDDIWRTQGRKKKNKKEKLTMELKRGLFKSYFYLFFQMWRPSTRADDILQAIEPSIRCSELLPNFLQANWITSFVCIKKISFFGIGTELILLLSATRNSHLYIFLSIFFRIICILYFISLLYLLGLLHLCLVSLEIVRNNSFRFSKKNAAAIT